MVASSTAKVAARGFSIDHHVEFCRSWSESIDGAETSDSKQGNIVTL